MHNLSLSLMLSLQLLCSCRSRELKHLFVSRDGLSLMTGVTTVLWPNKFPVGGHENSHEVEELFAGKDETIS